MVLLYLFVRTMVVLERGCYAVITNWFHVLILTYFPYSIVVPLSYSRIYYSLNLYCLLMYGFSLSEKKVYTESGHENVNKVQKKYQSFKNRDGGAWNSSVLSYCKHIVSIAYWKLPTGEKYYSTWSVACAIIFSMVGNFQNVMNTIPYDYYYT